MNDVTGQALTLLLIYGYPLLFAAVLSGAVGLPLPRSVLLMAAGGLAAEEELDVMTVLAVVATAAVLGDRLNNRVVRRMTGATGLAIFLTRWLLTPLSLPVTIGAGLVRYPLLLFVTLALAGDAVWTVIYVSIGYFVGESWTTLSDVVSESGGLIAGIGILLVAGIGWILWTRGSPKVAEWEREAEVQADVGKR
jgi:membrane protein DedA with SNARE-associated domain